MSDTNAENSNAAGKRAKLTLKYKDGIFWAVGLVLTALSVAFAARSGFGVSMIVAPAYILHIKVSEALPWFTFGISEFLVQLVLIVAIIFIVKEVRMRFVLTFGTAAIYGAILDLWRGIVGTGVPDDMQKRIMFAALGIVICSFAIALMFRTSWPQESYEMFVKDVSEHYGVSTDKFKWGYDMASLAIAVVLMLVLLKTFSFELIGPGTLATTLINAPLIAVFGKIIDRVIR